jgi:hypothetical protein
MVRRGFFTRRGTEGSRWLPSVPTEAVARGTLMSTCVCPRAGGHVVEEMAPFEVSSVEKDSSGKGENYVSNEQHNG